MKILIIGGTGVLSTDILKRSLECGYDISVLNRGSHNSLLPKDVVIYKANIRNIDEVQAQIGNQKFDVIIDFLSFKVKDLENTFEFFKNKCIQYIFISSACAFRRNAEDGILVENSPKPNKNLPYSIDKYECENWLLHHAPKTNCKYTIVRPYITYGDTRIPFGIAPLARYHWTIVARILHDKPMFLWDDGVAQCTLTHTEDFAYNFVQLFLNEKIFNEDINLVGNQVYSWREMLETLYDLLNKDKKNIISIPTKQISEVLPCYRDFLIGDRALDAVFDNSKLKKSISDFRQTISLKVGLTKTLNYYTENNFLDGIDYKYDARLDKLLENIKGVKYSFIDYLNTHNTKERIIYNIYRNLSEKKIDKLYAMYSQIRKIVYSL